MALSDADLRYLNRCVELAREALDNGDAPFGAVLVGGRLGDDRILYEDRNRTGAGDPTRHAEFNVAQWAAANLAPVRRVRTTVYTSCEHCPMCAAAHAWVGLGRIVYATSAAQTYGWIADLHGAPPPVAPLPITAVAPKAVAEGPAPQLADALKALFVADYRRRGQPGGAGRATAM